MSKVKTQLVIEGKNNAKPALDQASRQLAGLSSEAKAAGVALAGVFSVGAFAAWIKTSIDAADAASKAAASTGLAVEQYTALQYAADLAGVGVAGFDAALTKFNRTIAKAAAGGEAQLEAFQGIGVAISATDGQLKTTDQLLSEVADRFQEMPDGAQKTALAMDLFGKSGAKLIPFLNAGAEGIAELKAEAEALGLVISAEQAAQAEVFSDNITRMGAAAQGAANQISGEILPSLVDLSELLVDVNKNTEASSVLATALGGALKVLATAVIIVGASFARTGNLIAGAAAAAMASAKGKFSEAADIMRMVSEDNARSSDEAMLRIKALWDGSGEAAAQAATRQKEIEQQREADYSEHLDNLDDQQRQSLNAGKNALRERVAAERAANAEVNKLRKAQLENEQRFNDARSKLAGGGQGRASYARVQDLKIQARNALREKDYEGASRGAQEALNVLLELQAAGENSYGFQGLVDELQAIGGEADRISLANAEQSAAAATSEVKKLKALLDEIKVVKVEPKLSEEARSQLIAKMQELAAEIGQTLTIPVRFVPQPIEATAEMKSMGLQGGAEVNFPGYATGGHVRGPGTGTSDSILARLSNGEYVVRAAAVRRYGTSMLDRLNGLQLPKFADGGLVSAASQAGSPSLGTINLMLDGQNYTMQAGEQDFASLVRRQRMKRGSTR